MPQGQSNLSPSLFGVLLEQIADGNLRPASLINQVQNDMPISYDNMAARFTKERPGVFNISFYKDGNEVGTETASSPVEAKLIVLDYAVQAVRKARQAQKGNNNTQ